MTGLKSESDLHWGKSEGGVMKSFHFILKLAVLGSCIGMGVSKADPVSDAISSINTEYHKDHQLGLNQDFVNLERTAGSGTFTFGAKLYLRGVIDGKANASNLGATRFVASPVSGFDLKAFGSTVPVVEARYDVGNFKTTSLSQTPPAGATLTQFKGQLNIKVFNALVYAQTHYQSGVSKSLGSNHHVLWSSSIPIAGPLSVNLAAGTTFSKALTLSVEAQSSAVNLQAGANLLKSNAMNEFTTAVSSNAGNALSNYYSNAATQSVQDRSVSAIGRALSAPIGNELRFGASVGPEAAVGIWAEASASISCVFMGVDVGVRGVLNAITASLKGMLSASNISQYLDFILRGQVGFLSGYLEAFGRLWGGFRICFWGCWDWTFTIAEGSVTLVNWSGFQFMKDILIARLDLKGPSLHWCLTGNDEKCTLGYVVDPVPQVLDDYYFSCPQSFMSHNFRDKLYLPQAGELRCNYLDSVTNAECAANPNATAVNENFNGFFFNLQYKYCRQPVAGAIPKKLSISREEACPATFTGKPLQSHVYNPFSGTTQCSYQGSIQPSECLSAGGTVSTTTPKMCYYVPAPGLLASISVVVPPCPAQFVGRSLFQSAFDAVSQRQVCIYGSTVTPTACVNSGNFEVQVGLNEYVCQNTPYSTGGWSNAYGLSLPSGAPAVIQKVREPSGPFHVQASTAP